MNRVSVDNVNGLDDERRRHLEAIVGAPLEEDSQVVVMVYKPAKIPTEEARRAAVVRLQRLFAKTDAHLDGLEVSDEEIDAIVDEAVEHARGSRAS